MPTSSFVPLSTLVMKSHLLNGPNVSFFPSPNSSGSFDEGLPDTIVIHFTAGSSLASSVDVMTNSDSKVSAHFAIGRNGDIVQMLPTNKIAWHAGKSSYKGRTNLNRYSIGIELDNAGQLTQNSRGEFKTWFGKTCPQDDVVAAVHRNQTAKTYWHRFTDEQIARTYALCKALCQRYHIKMIVGHEEIAPVRKIDPGPAFPLDELRARLLNIKIEPARETKISAQSTFNSAEREVVSKKRAGVNASTLNVRLGPGTDFEKIKGEVNKGDMLTIIEKQGEWARVSYTATGWVNTRYINEVSEKLPSK